jgi:hypothetical protein
MGRLISGEDVTEAAPGFESLCLRQQVFTAEKFRRRFPKYPKYAHFS